METTIVTIKGERASDVHAAAQAAVMVASTLGDGVFAESRQIHGETTATDALILTLDNDRPLYERCMHDATFARHATHDEETTGIWTHAQAELFHTADKIKERVEFWMDDISLKPCPTIQPSMRESANLLARTFIQMGLEEIKWNEVAQHFLDKVDA